MNCNSKTTLAVAVVVSALTGLLGGFLGGRLGSSPAALPADLTVQSLTADKITTRSFVADTEEEGVKCQIEGGSIIASKSIVGARLSGNIVAAKSIIASDKPATESLENQRIVAELAAMPGGGGVLILRNEDGANTPSKGPVREGEAIFLGFDKNGTPMAYTQEIPRGDEGRAFFVRAIRNHKSPDEATAQADPAAQPDGTGAASPTAFGDNRLSSPQPAYQPGAPSQDPQDRPPLMATPGGDTFRR